MIYTTSEKSEKAILAVIEAKYNFEESKIFFSKELSKLIEEVIKTTHNAWFDASWNNRYLLADIDDERIKEETMKKRLKVWTIVKDKVPALKEELEDMFRKLLGVE